MGVFRAPSLIFDFMKIEDGLITEYVRKKVKNV